MTRFAGWILMLACCGLLAVPALARGDEPGVGTAEADTLGPGHKVLASSQKMRISAYPYIYYTPETELAAGAGGIVTFYTQRDAILNASKVTASAYITSNGQYKFSGATDLYFTKNKNLVSGGINYGRYEDKFWGIGGDSPDLGTEAYIKRVLGVTGQLQFPPLILKANSLRSGITFDLSSTEMVDFMDNPYLADSTVVGVDGGKAIGLGLVFDYDSRNRVFSASSGGYYQFEALWFGSYLGSEYDFNSYTLDLRRYQALGADNRVLAVMFLGNVVGGRAPFYKLPGLGGSNIMRGYFTGRYRDDASYAAQAEVRLPIKGRFGWVAFGGFGNVAESVGLWSISNVKVSYGIGLRFAFNQAEKVNLRVDYGQGQNTSGVYFGLEEAF